MTCIVKVKAEIEYFDTSKQSDNYRYHLSEQNFKDFLNK